MEVAGLITLVVLFAVVGVLAFAVYLLFLSELYSAPADRYGGVMTGLLLLATSASAFAVSGLLMARVLT